MHQNTTTSAEINLRVARPPFSNAPRIYGENGFESDSDYEARTAEVKAHIHVAVRVTYASEKGLQVVTVESDRFPEVELEDRKNLFLQETLLPILAKTWID